MSQDSSSSKPGKASPTKVDPEVKALCGQFRYVAQTPFPR
jgi:hypothetical protein